MRKFHNENLAKSTTFYLRLSDLETLLDYMYLSDSKITAPTPMIKFGKYYRILFQQ